MDNVLDYFVILVAIVGGLGTIVGTVMGVIKYIRKPIFDKLDSMDKERTEAKKETTKTLKSLHHQVQLVKAGNLILCEALMQHDDKINGKVKLFRDKYFKEVYAITNINDSEIEDIEDTDLTELLNDEQLLDDL